MLAYSFHVEKYYNTINAPLPIYKCSLKEIVEYPPCDLCLRIIQIFAYSVLYNVKLSHNIIFRVVYNIMRIIYKSKHWQLKMYEMKNLYHTLNILCYKSHYTIHDVDALINSNFTHEINLSFNNTKRIV